METQRTLPGLLSLGICILIGVGMAAGGTPGTSGTPGTPPKGEIQQDRTDVHNDQAAMKECYEKVRADRAKLEQDRQAFQQLKESQSGQGTQGNQQALESLKDQYRQDMQKLEEDRETCMKQYQQLQKDRQDLQQDRTVKP
jgi:hypothetical protein